ncbi:MAG: glycosyltransferase family 2 protein [Candidatus Levyibacteriota bacterium]|nr:MAG: glycosyltransferase family 2 protein [Candidatus Levybacteria bacterium]
MKLSIIIPVFNEEKTITQVLEKVVLLKLPGVEKEIIVVDDGSTDSSKFKIQNLKFMEIKFFSHEKNQGKGAAVKTGIKNATGDYIIIQDADLEYNPKDIQKLMEPILNGKAKVVYGTRLKRLPNFSKDEKKLRFFVHYLGNKFLSLLTSILYRQWITDMETGYKLIPRGVLQKITLHARSFDFEPEITAKILKNHIKILEIPISTNPRGYDQGKKLNTVKDGIFAFMTLLKYRFFE